MKKKLLFALLVVTVLLLCAGTALAATLPCDKCGGATSKTGSGSSCSWYCQACDYTSRRSHDPNASSSGLVPDSCTGHCRWCGASAVYSSHVFNKYVSNGDETCEKNGTETSVCANPQCSVVNTRTETGSAPGHNYIKQTQQPTCLKKGSQLFVCSRCKASYEGAELPALGHNFSQWVSVKGVHSAICLRSGCDDYASAPCTPVTMQVGGAKVNICTVCGAISSAGGDIDLNASENVTVAPSNGKKLDGALSVLVDAAPIDTPLQVEALYMLIVSMSKDGVSVNPDAPVEITIALSKHPYNMDSDSFSCLPISELTPQDIKLYLVAQETVGAETREVWHEYPFTIKHGVMTFTTDVMGVYLLVPSTVVPPAAE